MSSLFGLQNHHMTSLTHELDMMTNIFQNIIGLILSIGQKIIMIHIFTWFLSCCLVAGQSSSCRMQTTSLSSGSSRRVIRLQMDALQDVHFVCHFVRHDLPMVCWHEQSVFLTHHGELDPFYTCLRL